MNNIVNENDFKYYMQDIERYYFGARYSYSELLNNEMVPFKYKTIITKYLKDEVDYETTLESHFYHMNNEGFDYKIYKQLRARVRASQYKDPAKREKGFKEKIYTIEQLSRISPKEKESLGIIIRELIISKLAMFGFSA
ncbi:hypothetical protein D6855_03435 [Butyrivibrio sp. CB08]|uniref:hypothetical protein n=1 Tax=Butyrivibrio sp. CB08 TaxID=2364879 RepID=UPI000EA92C1F|nr:hypothetical protein [Butyrivibrio sp. CB08]RKM62479.1 hypothetical protein D6855_03435 [Butyrivibrio sp. CB08]